MSACRIAIVAASGFLLGACGGPSSTEPGGPGGDGSADASRDSPDAAENDATLDGADDADATPPNDASQGDGPPTRCSALVPCASSQYCHVDCVLEMTQGYCTDLPADCQGVAACGCVPLACGDAGECKVLDGGGLVAGCPCNGPH